MNSYIYKLANKKFLVIFLLIILVIFLVNYVFSNSRLEITNTTSEEVVLFIEGEAYQQKLELKPQEKVGLRLKKASYSLETTSANKQTKYVVNLNHLLKKTVLGLDLKTVNDGVYLGDSKFRCGREIDKKPVFYSCSPSRDGLIESAGNVGLSPLLKEELASVDGEEIVENKSTVVIKPYKNVFLEAKKMDNQLFISKRTTSGYTEPAIIKVGNFESDITDSTFSLDETTGKYALLDKNAKSITYGSIDLKEQKLINYSAKKLESAAYDISLGIGGEEIYLLATRSAAHIENHDKDDTENKVEQAISPQLVVYDATTGKELKNFKFNKTAILSGISFGPGGMLYFIANKSAAEGGGAFLIQGTDFVSFKTYGNGANPPCWADQKAFYYVDAEGDSIYKYYIDQKAAYLVYQNNSDQNFLSSISCADQSLYFSIASQSDGELDVLNHYRLGSGVQAGRPAEEVLPKYFLVDDASYKASLVSAKKIRIELVYNTDSSASINKKAVQESLRNELIFEGVNIDSYALEYVN